MPLTDRQQRLARRFSALITERARERMKEQGIEFSKEALMQACFAIFGERRAFDELKREAERIVKEEEDRGC
jgi:hypothetical protein